jgi:hypothetical protein
MVVFMPAVVLAAPRFTSEMPASYARPVMVTPAPASVGGIRGFWARIRALMSKDDPASPLMTGPSPAMPSFVKRMPTPSGENSPSLIFSPLM